MAVGLVRWNSLENDLHVSGDEVESDADVNSIEKFPGIV